MLQLLLIVNLADTFSGSYSTNIVLVCVLDKYYTQFLL